MSRLAAPPIGERFGRLVVAGAPFIRQGHQVIPCCCGCGAERDFRVAALRKGRALSCGCARLEKAPAIGLRSVTHGHARGRTISKEYRAWRDMLNRCYRRATRRYERYGGRGITVCSEWRSSFEVFIRDLGPHPGKGYSLDRKNSDGNYEPGNCRWATRQEQSRNKAQNHRVEIDGLSLPIIEWSERSGVPANRIALRLRAGWDARSAVFDPARR